jgi:hypothetical protein
MRDGPALTAAIRDLLAAPDVRRQLAQAGKAHVSGRFDAASLARRTEAMYDTLLAAY